MSNALPKIATASASAQRTSKTTLTDLLAVGVELRLSRCRLPSVRVELFARRPPSS